MGHDTSIFINYFWSLFSSPLCERICVEEIREYFQQHERHLPNFYDKRIAPQFNTFYGKAYSLGYFLYHLMFGMMPLATRELMPALEMFAGPTELTSSNFFGFFVFTGVFFVLVVISSLILSSFLGLYGVFIATTTSLFFF